MPILRSDPQDSVGEFEERARMCRTLKPGGVPCPSTEERLGCELAEIRAQLDVLTLGQAKIQAGVLRMDDKLAGLTLPSEGCASLAPVPPSPNGNTPRRRSILLKAEMNDLCEFAQEPVKPQKRNHTVLPRQKKLMREVSELSLRSLQEWKAQEEHTIPWASEASKASRNSFGDPWQTVNDDMHLLHQIFAMGEEQEAKEQQLLSLKRYPCAYSAMLVEHMSSAAWEATMDSIIGAIVVLNCIFIGIAMDYSDDSAQWVAVDVTFSFIFLFELFLKLTVHGCRGHLCGSYKYGNIFDALVVMIDAVQLVVVVFFKQAATSRGAPSASIFRVIRLGRLSRTLRLLRQPAFNDVQAMLHGMMGGMTTLFWAVVLFLTTVFVVALVFRESFGRQRVEDVYDLFDSVPRAMLTTFRCSFGDCTTPKGVPIFEYVHHHYGTFYTLIYCLFIFFVTIGLFNVISSIFVQTTMNSASQLAIGKKKARLQDDLLWCTRVSTLVRRLLVIHAGHDPDVKLTRHMQEIYDLDVPCAVIDDLVNDPVAIAALNALDIVPEDRDYLSDILDPDNGGTINVIELVEGLRRLRGDPRRSDIVTINLMIRSLQRNVADMSTAISKWSVDANS